MWVFKLLNPLSSVKELSVFNIVCVSIYLLDIMKDFSLVISYWKVLSLEVQIYMSLEMVVKYFFLH